jgi:hypothetical protein
MWATLGLCISNIDKQKLREVAPNAALHDWPLAPVFSFEFGLGAAAILWAE